ncbi:MAG: hypothetical protein ABIE22_04375 [archaeon]
MGKITAWLVTALGLLLVVNLVLMLLDISVLGSPIESSILGWLIAVIVLAVGINKLVMNYKS